MSFLFKTTSGHHKDSLDSGVKDGRSDEYDWSLEVGSSVQVMVSYGKSHINMGKSTGKGCLDSLAFTFQIDSMFGTVRLYQKGSMANVLISSNVYPQDRNTRLTLGSVQNTKGFYASNFKVLKTKLSDEEIQKNGNLSFRKGERYFKH